LHTVKIEVAANTVGKSVYIITHSVAEINKPLRSGARLKPTIGSHPIHVDVLFLLGVD
jgi:hypothetical protein